MARSRAMHFMALSICIGFISYSACAQEAPSANTTASASLKLVNSAVLPGISGDFDHFAVDLTGRRLFLAAEDHKTLEVLSLTTGKSLRSIKGFGIPHSILYFPESDQITVTDGGEGTVKILRGSDYSVVESIKLVAGADSIGFDTPAHRLYVVTGGKDVPMDHSFLTAVDMVAKKEVGEIRFDSDHVEAMALEHDGSRLFINVTDRNYIAVVDRKTMSVTARWRVGVAEQNSPIALDEASKRLFIVCRQPATLVVMNSETGAIVTSLPASARADDVVFDKANHRIYVPGGEGHLSVFEQQDADHYKLRENIPTAPGAKTALLVPELSKLFVAVSPGDTKAEAKVLTFEVEP